MHFLFLTIFDRFYLHLLMSRMKNIAQCNMTSSFRRPMTGAIQIGVMRQLVGHRHSRPHHLVPIVAVLEGVRKETDAAMAERNGAGSDVLQ